VDDTARGFIAAACADSDIHGETIDLGTGHAVSIGELVDMIADIMDKKFNIQEDIDRVRPEKSEVMKLISNNKRAKDLLGSEPGIEIEQGLLRTIDWIKKNQNIYCDDEYTV